MAKTFERKKLPAIQLNLFRFLRVGDWVKILERRFFSKTPVVAGGRSLVKRLFPTLRFFAARKKSLIDSKEPCLLESPLHLAFFTPLKQETFSSLHKTIRVE